MKIHNDHLEKARQYSRLPESKMFYFKHLWWAIHTAFLLFYWGILMVVHAIVPQLVGFTVIERIVDFIRHLKKIHPDDPILSKIDFNDQ